MRVHSNAVAAASFATAAAAAASFAAAAAAAAASIIPSRPLDTCLTSGGTRN